jgi:hypothetical protein
MPSYNTVTPPPQLGFGAYYLLVNNAVTDTGVTVSQQIQVSPSDAPLQLTNGTNQTATIQYSPVDADNPGTSPPVLFYEAVGTVASDASASFAIQAAGYIRVTFASAPTSGSIAVSR